MHQFFRSSVCLTALSLAAWTAGNPGNLAAQAPRSVDGAKVSKETLAKMVPHNGQYLASRAFKNHAGVKLGAASTFASVPGIDSLTNWTGQFTTPGFDSNNNPQSVWPFEMVGNPPESGKTAVLRAPIVPVTVRLLDQNGNVANNNGFPLIARVSSSIVNAVVKSPLFQPFTYTSGAGQINDQMMRAQFWNRIGRGEDSGGGGNWHTLLAPQVQTTRSMSIPFGSWFFTPNDDGSCCLAVYLDENAFISQFFPPTFPVNNTTVIGAAELAGDVTTKDLSTFLFNNVYLYGGDISNCCVLGFHTYDFEPGIPANGNLERRYVLNYSSWITNGLFSHGFEDITATSHEIAETFDDPFVDNATPWWLSFDKFSGASLCQNNLETGDVVEILRYNGVFPISMSGRTYHPQNEAIFPWFAFQSPSRANLRAYSFPDETTLTALSPGPLHAGCAP
jgi:hypothetical protein